jgi:hypothetical protein
MAGRVEGKVAFTTGAARGQGRSGGCARTFPSSRRTQMARRDIIGFAAARQRRPVPKARRWA